MSTPTWISRTSCIKSTTVWRSPSRLPSRPRGAAALLPSVESMLPLPSWSMPRPPAGTTTGAPSLRDTFSVPSAPPPWPTTWMAMVAMPCAAKLAATVHGAPYMLSPKPWPKMATGQPPAGLVPLGTKTSTIKSLLPCGTGVPVSVPVAGMYFAAVS